MAHDKVPIQTVETAWRVCIPRFEIEKFGTST